MVSALCLLTSAATNILPSRREPGAIRCRDDLPTHRERTGASTFQRRATAEVFPALDLRSVRRQQSFRGSFRPERGDVETTRPGERETAELAAVARGLRRARRHDRR